MYATVVDRAGRLVPDLERQDFEIYDNDKKQELTLFKSDIQPITVIVMLDTSGSMTFNLELLKQAAGIQAVHVPYKGGAACQTDIMGNQVDFSFQNLGAVTNYIKAGRMKALAVTAKARHPQLPDVPSAAEAGYPDLVVTSWQAVAAPARTPRDVVAKLNDATVRALRSPEIRERMTQIGFDVVGGTPEEFGAFMKAEIERWTRVVERGGIKPD